MEQQSSDKKQKHRLRAKIKRFFHDEHAKLKEMTFGEKFAYIWEYYKVHIIFTIAIVIFSLSLGKTIYRNIKYQPVFHCAVINNMLNDTEEDYLIQGFGDYIGIDDASETITFDSSYYLIWDNSSYSNVNYSSRMKIAAALGAKTIDIFVADSTYMVAAAREEQLYDLSSVLPEELFNAVEEYLFYAEDIDGTSRPFAVDLSSTHLADGIFYQDPPLYAIVVNTERLDTALDFLRYAFEIEKP